MNRGTFLSLARGARQGDGPSLERFKTAMRKAGYVGKRGGWIYTPGAERASWQGWQNIASRVVDGYEPAVIRRVLEAHAEPVPAGTATREPTEDERAMIQRSVHDKATMMDRRSPNVLLRCIEAGWIKAETWRATDAGMRAIGYSTDEETGTLLDEVLGPEPCAIRVPHVCGDHGEIRPAEPIIEYRAVATPLVVSRHLAKVDLRQGTMVGRLACGTLATGRVLGEVGAPLDLRLVDCLGCLDTYTEETRTAPIVNGDLGVRPTPARSVLIKP
jgi:hypothetical protein